jgi:hypothetical protein
MFMEISFKNASTTTLHKTTNVFSLKNHINSAMKSSLKSFSVTFNCICLGKADMLVFETGVNIQTTN